MLEGVQLDPYTVLGVTKESSGEQIQQAFHEKSKRYHPDVGGDDWAFRIVLRAYEILSSRARRDAELAHPAEDPEGRLRPGVYDKKIDPTRIVGVEIVWLRYEISDLNTMMKTPMEERHLSGSLNLVWPDRTLVDRSTPIREGNRILRLLHDAFDEICEKTEPLSARWQIVEGRFEAWLGYPHGQAASDAFRVYHEDLKNRGL